MAQKAILLTENSGRTEEGNFATLLDFFGIPASHFSVTEFIGELSNGNAGEKIRLLCQASTFLRLLEALDSHQKWSAYSPQRVHSVLVYAGEDSASLKDLTRKIAGDSNALNPIDRTAEWTISDKYREFTKSMSGLSVPVAANSTASVRSLDNLPSNAINIISGPQGAAFSRIDYQTVPIFLAASATIIDINTRLGGRNFDIRENFITAVPVVMYLKWAFAGSCWEPAETIACLVIDDPLLKPRYGFLNFQRFLELMRQHHFSTSIAFIPWNWRRSARKVVELFKESAGKFSLSIHGCDHTGGEFGSLDRGRLAWKSRQATDRMAHHESRTGIRHDRVMVFPQGVFSEAAMGVLKRGGFIGVVNSEVISSDPQPRAVTVADFWDVAVMKYDNFPIFTRRYPSDGVENFAFDILLGKPCVVVIHHNDCSGQYRRLVAFIDGLNGLQARLSWQNLTKVVHRSFRQREVIPGTVEIEMYGTELCLTNNSAQRKRYQICRRDFETSEICVDSQPISWKSAANRVVFEIELNGGESKIIRAGFGDPPKSSFKGESQSYRVKAAARRLLSEFRDNYVTRKPFSS